MLNVMDVTVLFVDTIETGKGGVILVESVFSCVGRRITWGTLYFSASNRLLQPEAISTSESVRYIEEEISGLYATETRTTAAASL
jgi:hypothetical protein